jgi:hypothetical protein
MGPACRAAVIAFRSGGARPANDAMSSTIGVSSRLWTKAKALPDAPPQTRNRDIQPVTFMTLAVSFAPGGPSRTTSFKIFAWSFSTVNSPGCGAFPPITS